jgi:hypothetical protein
MEDHSCNCPSVLNGLGANQNRSASLSPTCWGLCSCPDLPFVNLARAVTTRRIFSRGAPRDFDWFRSSGNKSLSPTTPRRDQVLAGGRRPQCPTRDPQRKVSIAFPERQRHSCTEVAGRNFPRWLADITSLVAVFEMPAAPRKFIQRTPTLPLPAHRRPGAPALSPQPLLALLFHPRVRRHTGAHRPGKRR